MQELVEMVSTDIGEGRRIALAFSVHCSFPFVPSPTTFLSKDLAKAVALGHWAQGRRC
jgi:hypothetical protein